MKLRALVPLFAWPLLATGLLSSAGCAGKKDPNEEPPPAPVEDPGDSDGKADNAEAKAKYKHSVEAVNLRGVFNQWGLGSMRLVGDYTWQLEQDILGYRLCQFKFDTSSNWTGAYGDTDGDGVCEKGGENIRPSQCDTGRYLIQFNDKTLAYTVTRKSFKGSYETLHINGTNQYESFGLVADHKWATIATFDGYSALNQFRFEAATAQGTTLLGDAQNDGVVDENGKPIDVGHVGAYRITLDDRTGAYTYQFVPSPYSTQLGQLAVRGSFNSWAFSPMTLVGDGVWVSQVMFTDPTGGTFKFDVTGDWSQNFGQSSQQPPTTVGWGQATLGGQDIGVSSGGQYRVAFYEDGKQYMFQKQGGWTSSLQSATVLSSYTPSMSTTPTATMALIEDHVWEGFISLPHGGYPSVKIQAANQGASTLYGDNDLATDLLGGGTLEAQGAWIALGYPGSYRVTFDDRTMAYSVGYYPAPFARHFQSVALSGTPNGQGATPLVQTGDNTWETEVVHLGTGAGSFVLHVPEAGDFGTSARNGVASVGGPAFPLATAGTYHVVFNDKTLAYKIERRQSGTYGKVNLQVSSVRVTDGNLVETPLANAGLCVDVQSGQLCSNGGWFLNNQGQAVLDLPAGAHKLSFGASMSSHWYFTGGLTSVQAQAGQQSNVTVQVVPETTCVSAYAQVGAGKALYITGQSRFLGDWNTAYKMQRQGDHWFFQGSIPSGLQFKILRAADGAATIPTQGVQWQQGGNSVLADPQLYMGGAPRCSEVRPTF